MACHCIVKIDPEDPSLPPLETFLQCLITKSNSQLPALIVSLILMNRFITKISKPVPELGRKLYLTCLMLATKLTIEPGFTNGAWARLVKMETTEMNKLEAYVLYRIEYKLHVGEREFWRWKTWGVDQCE